MYDYEFWSDEAIAAYLSGVPDYGMIILDLSSEDLPVWNKISANNKQFIYCMLHNYGGSRALYGNLTLLTTDPIDTSTTVPGASMLCYATLSCVSSLPLVSLCAWWLLSYLPSLCLCNCRYSCSHFLFHATPLSPVLLSVCI